MSDLGGQENVLVAVVGLTPAVVTQALYGLSVLSTERVPVHRVDIIGTLPAIELSRNALLGSRGALSRLARVYQLPTPTTRFHVLRKSPSRAPLMDLRTTEDNHAAWLQVFRIVRALLPRSQTLLGSIAGGRKTLSHALVLAFQLLGRRQDRLFHVLLRPEQTGNPNFFFPLPGDEVQIDLAEVPFLRTRELNTHSGNLDLCTFLSAVQTRVEIATEPQLVFRLSLDGSIETVSIGGRTLWPNTLGIRLRQRDLHLWLHLAWLRSSHNDRATDYPCACCFRTPEQLSELVPPTDRDFPQEYVRQAMSRIKSALLEFGLPLEHADKLRFRGAGQRPYTKYGVHLSPRCISITRIG